MRSLIFIIFIMLLAFQLHSETEQKREPVCGGWDHTGELSYSYAYARNWLGARMRTGGWRCTKSFTAGPRHEVEHSIWVRGTRTVQMMIWRISSDRTGYSQKYLSKEKSRKIL